ncbi:hypothetical protein C1I91_19575 [Clostridium manihotivorum]|uniref:Uncharacterized protein n=2 Tax=Clostridium manihotivorum TaxID=2320868 RepID=A0A410DX62_9CLOT|nr:hypothetical protein C1I91_19575 [Clostridium manihotivorum]
MREDLKVFMRKKLLVFILVIIVAISGSMLFSYSRVSKGYELNKIGSNTKVIGELIKDHQYKFHSNIVLGNDGALAASILDLSLCADIEFDASTNNYLLKNPKLQITPIGCEQYDKEGEYLTSTSCSANYKFGMKPNQAFKQTIDVGYAKLLLDNKNIKITNIRSEDPKININSISDLKRFKDNNADILIQYNTLQQYFTQWYNIKFNLTSDKEGVFSIN